MNHYKQAIVIDKQGYKVKLVLSLQDKNGVHTPQYYVLQVDESLVFDNLSIALSMIKPRWNGNKWEETATEEELEVARSEPQVIKEPVSDLDIAFAEYVIETEQRLTELEDKINA